MSLHQNSTNEQNSWELSKENIQPLKSGRSMSSIGLSPANDNLLKQQRQCFEEELRLNNGDDPLEVWYRYIKWTEQNYPSGKDNQLRSLVQKCLAALKDHKQYSNDFRWWYIWQKFAFLSSNVGSLGIYEFMYQSDQCTRLAAFYKQWAFELEQAEDFPKAADVYKKGIAERAQPLTDLENASLQFELRIGRKLMSQVDDDPVEEETTRNFLGVLKGVGKKAAAPVVRRSCIEEVKVAKAAEKQTVTTTTREFKVFDENQGIKRCPVQQNKDLLRIESVTNEGVKENFRKPDIWTKQKIKTAASCAKDSAEFRVFVDLDENSMQSKEKSKPLISGDVLKPIIKKEVPNPLQTVISVDKVKNNIKKNEYTEVPAYNENLVYGGVIEMSFEELRALKYEQKVVKTSSFLVNNNTSREIVGEKSLIAEKSIHSLKLAAGGSVLKPSLEFSNLIKNQHTDQILPSFETRTSVGKDNHHFDAYEAIKPSAVVFPKGSSTSNQPISFTPAGIIANTSFTSNVVRDALAVFSNTLQLNSLGDGNNQSAVENSSSLLKDDVSDRTSISVQQQLVAKPAFNIFDENAKRPCLVVQPNDEDKENVKPPGMFSQQPPKRQTSGILTPALDIATEPIEEGERISTVEAVVADLFPNIIPPASSAAAKSNSSAIQYDEYDPTVAGLLKNLLTNDRIASTPYRNASVNLVPSFSVTNLWPVQGQLSSFEEEELHQPVNEGGNKTETVCKESTQSNFVDRKLCTITETSREYRSSSCSSASSASSGDPLSSRRRF